MLLATGRLLAKVVHFWFEIIFNIPWGSQPDIWKTLGKPKMTPVSAVAGLSLETDQIVMLLTYHHDLFAAKVADLKPTLAKKC